MNALYNSNFSEFTDSIFELFEYGTDFDHMCLCLKKAKSRYYSDGPAYLISSLDGICFVECNCTRIGKVFDFTVNRSSSSYISLSFTRRISERCQIK